jgi:DNA repair protein RecN (Recombination protein N)
MILKTNSIKSQNFSLQFSEINQRFEENYIELKDTLFQLQNEAENIDTNSEDLLALQEQNDRINALFLNIKFRRLMIYLT